MPNANHSNETSSPKKSPWRFLFAGCAVYGGVQLLGGLLGLVLPVFLQVQRNLSPTNAATIGIIGGADGPTAIFVTSPPWTAYILPAVLTAAGILGYIRLAHKK